MTMTRVSEAKIEKQGRELARIFGWVFWLTSFWLFADISYVPLKRLGAALASREEDALEAILAFADVMILFLPIIFALCAVYTARTLLVQFAHGKIFSTENGASLARVGDWLLASAVAALFISPVTSLFIERNIETVGPDYLAVVLALIGLVLRLFGKTFTVAAEIKADNDQMI